MIKTTNSQVRVIIRGYIGLQIKFPDNPFSLKLALRAEMLPEDLRTGEGVILQAIHDLKAQVPPIEPNRDNLARWLAVNDMQDRIAMLDSIVGDVAEDEDASGLPTYDAFVDTWLQNQVGMAAMAQAAAIMNEPNPDYEDKYDRAAQAFASAIPKSMTSMEYTDGELADLVVRQNAALIAERAATGEIGWGLPFPAYKAFFSRFHPSEVTTIIAETGLGKTSLAMIVAEYQSWTQPIRSDSVLFELETTAEEIGQRQIARKLRLPYEAIDSGFVNLAHDPWKSQIDEFKAQQRVASEQNGHIKVKYCPGWTVEQIILLMQGYAQASLVVGRKVAFWIDNLQRIDWTGYGLRQHEAYELMADRLSYAIRRYPNTHLFLIAQEFDERVAGSRAIERMSQKMISLRREAPDGGMPDDFPIMARQANGNVVQRVDALGGKRFWHRRGAKHSGKATLEILKTNSGQTGKIEILFEGALSRMEQDPEQIEDLIQQGRLPKEKT